MVSLRLPAEIEDKLSTAARTGHLTKTDIVKLALNRYFTAEDHPKSVYDIGKDLFGKAGSGKGNLSQEYKRLLRKDINAKFSH